MQSKASAKTKMVQDIIEACSATGLQIKRYPSSSTPEHLVCYQHAPISLFATPYPLHLYKHILKLQPQIGCLVSNLTASPKLIHKLLEGFLRYDPFLEKLVGVSKQYNKFALSDDAAERKKV